MTASFETAGGVRPGGLRLRAEQPDSLGKPRHREGDEVEAHVDPEAIYVVSDA